INMSLGTTAGFSTSCLGSDSEGVELARIYKKLKVAGISVIAAASNDFSASYGSAFGTNLISNPDSGTVGSPSTFDGSVSVASVNGQQSPFIMANGKDPVFYTESSDANGVRNEFIKQMLGSDKSGTFKYVVVGGYGQSPDYDSYVRRELADKSQGKTVALVMRGSTTFQEKVQLAKTYGADAIIVYNNVAGTLGMSLGDLTNPIPAIFISQEDGQKMLRDERGYKRDTGVIELNVDYQSGPYMNDYSSWGSTPDLKLKPDITSHGGEITSTVAGGYAEMSGTSMATPNLAGFVALLRSYLKETYPDMTDTPQKLTRLVNQILMSTATLVYDQNGLPYSPRKQGAGLATLDNVFSTKAYLYTVEAEGGAEDNRPKIELGEDENKDGVYNLKFYVKNFGGSDLVFKPKATFMTESLSYDKQAVAERAYLMDGSPVWKVNGYELTSETITVGAGAEVSIECTLTISDNDREYLKVFTNGMFVEGFIQLLSEDAAQCNLILPYMGFYGDWEAAPMLDYDAYTLAKYEQDASIKDEEKPQARIWGTQAYATYYNEKYSIPLGGFLYVQDENATQKIYTDPEHSAISMHNVFYGEDATNNYMTANSIKALYAGLLRNAELVTYDLVNADTGELILSNNVYNVGKAHSGGGSAVPSQVKLELDPVKLGLEANGKYELNFHFYFKASDAENSDKVNDDNAFSMIFYVDYEAPVLVESRVRYYDYKDGNKDKQRVYLDLDVYDNHYAQSVLLCYSETATDDDDPNSIVTLLNLATDYVTPIYNANKNDTTTVTIEITDIYDKYKGNLYVQIDDYALNHSVYTLNLASSSKANLPGNFDIAGSKEVTIGVNEPYKIELVYDGESSPSNFTWGALPRQGIQIKGGEIFATKTGTYEITVTGAGGVHKSVTVHVIDKGLTLQTPTLSFGIIKNDQDSLQKAVDTVKVNAGQTFTLDVEADTWYYPLSNIGLHWNSDNPDIATVDQNGQVTTLNEKGTATITAVPVINGQQMSQDYAAIVTLSVQDPFTISNNALTKYHGSEEYVRIPDNKNVMTISAEAFKDNKTMKYVVIPKTVTQIDERAFINCTSLKAVYFIDEIAPDVNVEDIIPDANLTTIMSRAFENCTGLELVDLRNCKTITVDRSAFNNCTSLTKIENMATIGTMYQYAFEGCTSLKSVDLSGLHVSGRSVFKNCTSLEEVKTAYYTAIGEYMFEGCSKLENVTISTTTVEAYAFAGSGLKTVTFEKAEGETRAISYNIGEFAFANCTQLTSVDFKNNAVSSIGDCAFANCISLATVSGLNYSAVANKGIKIFSGTQVVGYGDDVSGGAIYSGTVLVLSPDVLPAGFTIRTGTTEIAPYAFADSKGAVNITIPDTVKVIGEGAFENSEITGVTLPSDLKQIPAYAFADSGITAITIPASVTVIGEGAFANCASLATVNFESGRTESLTIGSGAFLGCSALTQVVLPEITDGVLASGAFAYCTSLESINLNNVTKLDNGYEVVVKNGYLYFGAFANCIALKTVTGIDNLTDIGAYAFTNCASLEILSLTKSENVGTYAFAMPDVQGAYTSVNIPVAKAVGAFAFAGGKETSVEIPATLSKLGEGAFASSNSLTGISVEGGNATFFENDGVLYRVISGSASDGTYELCAFPAANRAGAATYRVIDGTVTVKAFAFFGLNDGAVRKVIFPYSLKTIGTSAFYQSGVTDYQFNCITAPVLLNDYVYNYALDSDGQRVTIYSYYNLNFNGKLFDYAYASSTAVSPLKISYPSNGIGYDNFVYANYFGVKTSLGELMDDVTRAVKTMIEGFMSAEEVKAWATADVDKATVEAFSEAVKTAHGMLNTIKGETQLGFLGAENIQKLTDIETELKPVKARFNIPVKVSSLAVAEGSTHKKEYAEGEKFNINGLKLLVIYDDYSTEVIDNVDLMKLDEEYAGGLTILNRYVEVAYGGKTVKVDINVTDEAAGGGNKLNPAVIYGPIIGVVVAAGIAVAVVFLLKKFKKSAKATEGDAPEEEKPEDKEE
ncbi:MAG: leucine-rich repeat protein, partial [Clostridia bacterium]|nr:leucine-rich repeat protein [Clostridia bacterium]